jgi:hypothetical protein
MDLKSCGDDGETIRMSREELFFWSPGLAVLVGVLFVNYFVPIKGRLDHSLATALSAGLVFGVVGLITRDNSIFIVVLYLMSVVFVADFISTFISFSNRIRNAIATTIVFVPLYFGAMFGLWILAGAPHGFH